MSRQAGELGALSRCSEPLPRVRLPSQPAGGGVLIEPVSPVGRLAATTYAELVVNRRRRRRRRGWHVMTY